MGADTDILARFPGKSEISPDFDILARFPGKSEISSDLDILDAFSVEPSNINMVQFNIIEGKL